MAIVKIDLEKITWFEMHFCISIFITLAHAASKWKPLNHEINLKKKNSTRNISKRKKFGSMNTHEKIFWTHEIPKRKNLGPTKYPTKGRWYDGTKFTRPTIACDPWSLAHLSISNGGELISYVLEIVNRLRIRELF